MTTNDNYQGKNFKIVLAEALASNKTEELEQQFAILHHFELIRGFKG